MTPFLQVGQVITLPLGKDLVDVEVGRKGKTSDIGMFREP